MSRIVRRLAGLAGFSLLVALTTVVVGSSEPALAASCSDTTSRAFVAEYDSGSLQEHWAGHFVPTTSQEDNGWRPRHPNNFVEEVSVEPFTYVEFGGEGVKNDKIGSDGNPIPMLFQASISRTGDAGWYWTTPADSTCTVNQHANYWLVNQQAAPGKYYINACWYFAWGEGAVPCSPFYQVILNYQNDYEGPYQPNLFCSLTREPLCF